MKSVDSFLKTAVKAARASGEIQKKGLGKAHQIHFKGEINIVTEIDKACEAKIQKMIAKEFPDHDFLMEESGAWNRPSDFKWIVDPLDGTTNYAHRYPLFCTSIALEHRGEIILGVIFEPNLSQLFVAVRGRGATLNGKKIRVSPVSDLKKGLLSTGFAYDVRTKTDNNIDRFRDFIMTAQAVRRDGVAAIDLCYVACGRFDGFWELDLWPWDNAAGMLMVREAGGKVTMFDGSPFDLYGKQIVASNGILHSSMLEVLERGRKK